MEWNASPRHARHRAARHAAAAGRQQFLFRILTLPVSASPGTLSCSLLGSLHGPAQPSSPVRRSAAAWAAGPAGRGAGLGVRAAGVQAEVREALEGVLPSSGGSPLPCSYGTVVFWMPIALLELVQQGHRRQPLPSATRRPAGTSPSPWSAGAGARLSTAPPCCATSMCGSHLDMAISRRGGSALRSAPFPAARGWRPVRLAMCNGCS